ncbi:MAG: 50S ribosomal protein L19e [Candidatus Diapherotrites archaeon]|nr:50S ribosomal protein L19e [Candidatus Diapherotrites archaeon]
MKESKAKKISARLLKVGTSKIWINPADGKKVKEAMTKEDVRSLIREGVIKEKKIDQKNKKRHLGRKKGRGRGMGKRKGTAKARIKTKKRWVQNVRALRKKLKEIKKIGGLKIPYRKAFLMVKGGFFRGKKHLEATVLGAQK